MLWDILIQFVFRLSFGIAVAMAVTPASLVTSGFYRVHLWVILGLCTFAALIAFSQGHPPFASTSTTTAAIATAVLSYMGAVVWIYEKRKLGLFFLVLVAAAAAWGAAMAWSIDVQVDAQKYRVAAIDSATAGLLLGLTITAMFLGHWYLNTPTMKLGPLQRLVLFMAMAAIARSFFCGSGLVGEIVYSERMTTSFIALLTLRWLSGLIGILVLSIMTWQTLKIPNTQSATGILYVAVIFVFLGELTSQLLSAETSFPL